MSDRAARRDRPSDRPGPSVPRPNDLEDPSSSEAGHSTQQRTRRHLPYICRDFNRREGCVHPDCQKLHLCSHFLNNRCTVRRCPKSHDLETPHNIQLLERSGWSGQEDMATVLDKIRKRGKAAEAASVCFAYNMGTCSDSSCGRLHICYRCVLDTCPLALGDCKLSHDLLDGGHNADLLTSVSAGLTDTSVPEIRKRLQEQLRRWPPQPDICKSFFGRQDCQGHCLQLHYCKFHLNNSCKDGKRCARSHSLKDPHNRRVLKFFDWTEEQGLRKLKSYRHQELQSPCGGSESGDDAETPVQRAGSAEEPGRQTEWQRKIEKLQKKIQQLEKDLKNCQEDAREKQRKIVGWEKREVDWKHEKKELQDDKQKLQEKVRQLEENQEAEVRPHKKRRN